MVKDYYKCPASPSRGLTCDPMFLAAIQVGRQEVTLNPPPPAVPFNSLVDKNISVFGLPEFSYYYKEIFLKQISNSSEYLNIKLSVDQCVKLFQYGQDGYIVASPQTLAHPVNMDRLVRAGLHFRQSQNINVFDSLTQQFGVDNSYVTRVLFEWSYYLATDFAQQGMSNLTVSTKGKWASTQAQENYKLAIDNIKPNIQTAVALSYITKNSLLCSDVIKGSIFNPDQKKIDAFCGSGWSKANIAVLL